MLQPMNGSVTIKRKLNNTNYGSIIMPFAPNSATRSNFKFYQLRNILGSYIYYSRVYSPSANVPYLYTNASSSSSKWASELASVYDVTIKATEKPSVSSGKWTTIGAYENMYITDKDSLSYHYIMSGGKLMNYTTSLTIYPFRAYFEGPVYSSAMMKAVSLPRIFRALNICIDSPMGTLLSTVPCMNRMGVLILCALNNGA